jgi:two-component system, response regulator
MDRFEILLIEDSPLDAELAMTGLRRGNAANHVTWVKDGQQAIDFLFRQGDYAQREDVSPGLIVLDLQMPKVGGIDVLKRIRSDERTRHIPVVVMTSSEEQSDLAKTYDLGANSYVVKPLDFAQFADVARNAGLYWLLFNRPAPKKEDG